MSMLQFIKRLSASQTEAPYVGSDNPLPVAAGRVVVVTAPTMTRPADTTQYSTGDLVANSTTAGSVVPLEFDVGGGSGMVRKIRIRTNRTSGGTTSAVFRVFLFRTAPTVADGDNAAFNPANAANFIDAMDVVLNEQFSDGAANSSNGAAGEINYSLPSGSTKLFGLVRAGAGYTPASAEQISVALEVLKDAV